MRGEELRALRKRLGMTLREMGEVLGVALNTVARWERGERGVPEPAARLVKRIVDERERG